ncbi:fumarylacetoacetate hydrolase family protein [Sphingomonas sp. LaA6.9]|uniref:fumarylacetoacetate hydrolase family protein n=1 Tax=Sphingomonas sp. LaA6.9 TaxID=2919914 RepID=UPI001F4FE992|nr:fumarylacetoacetate hydrolase family protein [Sphingomonas sp. LaA6.9]MCJ8159019.1 fumarylacetoacetate hydrolase family protein [Sphingomonas sp. LaA6.9]
MKIASIVLGTQIRAAVLVGEAELLVPSLIPAGPASALPSTVKGILAQADGLEQLRAVVTDFEAGKGASPEELRSMGALLSETGAQFSAPVSDPLHFMGCGASYHQHLEEMGGVPVPAHPILFLCSAGSLGGHRQPVIMPPHQATMLDYEGELAVVIGKPCYAVSVEEALNHVAGYTVHNDVSARDHVAEVKAVTVPTAMLDAWGRNVAAKQHPTLSPIGPYLVTTDEIPDPHALRMTTRVNGEIVQDVGTDDLIFSVAHYVSYVSYWYALVPGDIISTGTPGGVGAAKKPPVFLKEGDTVEVTITGLGTLSNVLKRSQ